MFKVYLDNSATTPVDKRVISAMKKYWRKDFGNPSSIHKMGVEAKRAVDDSRKKVANFLNAHDREIIFTSGGTEANNLTIFGLVKKILKDGKKPSEIHFITTKIEHSSILECFEELKSQGFSVDYLQVNQHGLVDPKDLRKVIKKETALISIGYANGEIGVVQPVKEIIKEIRHARKNFGREKIDLPYLHLDASQAVQYLNMNVEELGADMMTLDAQKIYGPKGIGALFVRDGIIIQPVILGGGQEKKKRAGTENTPLIVGFAKALEIVEKIKDRENQRLTKIRNYFFDKIKELIPNVIINGHLKERLPNNINISIPGKDGEFMVLQLDEARIVCSSMSACASGSGESYVVRQITSASEISKKDVDKISESTLRFSLGRDTRPRHIKKLLRVLKKIS